ncbi:MAG: glycerol-3-phosphate acyltransferase [Ignavibacteria bacterium]|nr:glycerol-3-phosphate acyltransferase [Ignavibacteria bacterium]
MSEYIFVSLFSYLLGSIPFAYILVKIFAKKDIRFEGTGNVGAMNSYDITGKKWIGFAVFLMDFSKGVGSLLFAKQMLPDNEYSLLASAVFVVLGHNYSIFLKFKGGKGLATASAILFMFEPILLLFWFISWLITYNLTNKKMDISNSIATVLVPFIFFFLPENFILSVEIIEKPQKILFFITLGILASIIISKHLPYLKKQLLFR